MKDNSQSQRNQQYLTEEVNKLSKDNKMLTFGVFLLSAVIFVMVYVIFVVK